MSQVDKEYLDARFDGLKSLMEAQDRNLNNFISAVGINVKEVRKDLQDHKESTDAHGLGAASRSYGNVVQWLGLAMATVAAGVSAFALRHK